jgi:hypothetical protein
LVVSALTNAAIRLIHCTIQQIQIIAKLAHSQLAYTLYQPGIGHMAFAVIQRNAHTLIQHLPQPAEIRRRELDIAFSAHQAWPHPSEFFPLIVMR